MPFAPDEYFERLYCARVSPFEGARNGEKCSEISAEIKKRLGEILELDKICGQKDEAVISLIKTDKRKSYVLETMSAEICDGLSMLCYVLIPDKPSGRGIAAFCGHGYGARQIIRQSKSGKYRKINFLDNYQKNFAHKLAVRGNIVIVPEFIGFGEARLKKDSSKPFYASSCSTVSHHLLLYGFSTASMRIFQAIKCIEILQSRYSCTDFGCMGISGGGLVALYTSLMDERIEKTCVCGYINTFKSSVLSRWHCPDNYIPGLLTVGEMYDFASALAPRNLMMQCGRKDKLFPIGGSELAIEKISEIYHIMGAEEKFVPVVFDGKHEVSLAQALNFFGEAE